MHHTHTTYFVLSFYFTDTRTADATSPYSLGTGGICRPRHVPAAAAAVLAVGVAWEAVLAAVAAVMVAAAAVVMAAVSAVAVVVVQVVEVVVTAAVEVVGLVVARAAKGSEFGVDRKVPRKCMGRGALAQGR